MRKISLASAMLVFLEDLEYTEAALGADDETKDLAKPFHEELSGWEDAFKKERISRRNVIRAEAVVAVRNAQLDGKTQQFGASALGEAGGDRKSPFFRRFFPVAPSQFVRQPLRKQCETTLHVVVVELDKLDKKHPLRTFLSPLTGLAKGALAALDARNKAKGERTMTTNDVDEWKEGVNALRLTTYAELLKIAAENGHPRSWADSFFPGETSGGDTAADDPGVPVPPAAPADAPADKAKPQ